jgi:primosomal protein N'
MARIVCRDQTLVKAQEEAEKLAGVLRQTNDRLAIGAVIRGPYPSPIERIAGYYRVQIELTAPHAAAVQGLLATVRDAGLLTSDFHTAVDMDPISLL